MANKKTVKPNEKQFDGTGGAFSGGCENPPVFDFYFDKYYKEFIDLIMNSVKIKNLSFAEENFVKTQLFGTGYVGFYDLMNKFYLCIPTAARVQSGRFWKRAQFKDDENVSLGTHWLSYDKTSGGDDWRVYIATPSLNVLFREAEQAALDLAKCDVGIMQNIVATGTPAFWTTDDDNFILSVRAAVQSTRAGEPDIIVKKPMGISVGEITNKTPFVADKIQEQKKIIRNEFLTRIGILTANSSKRERVQTLEIEAGVGESIDLIYSIIDYWNKQNETYGLPYEMEFNGTSEAYYAPTDDEIEEKEVKENERIITET